MRPTVLNMEPLKRAWSAWLASKILMDPTTWNTRPSRMVCLICVFVCVRRVNRHCYFVIDGVSLFLVSCNSYPFLLLLSK